MANTVEVVIKAFDQASSVFVNIGKQADKSLSTVEKKLDNMSKSIGEAGKKVQNAGRNISNVGSSLTNSITKPVALATAGVTGLVGALGFKRLVGLDTAQAKLKGLGYSAEDVGRISDQVTTALEGGMTTMAEGVDIAAGALAAGVDEGKELERYIKLVGDAAIGANKPVGEMAQIFNRVQGSGKLMTQELNMIEMGMPGFAQAMADNVADGSMEAFREMVTAGEVGSEEFLNVMDDFAGGMAGAYAESWEGMVKNTFAYVGIIGEALLEGLFKDGKKTLANFIEVLKSDEVQEWAVRTGEKISEVGKKVAETVKDIKKWWDDLSPAMQSVAVKAGLIGGGFLIALGPVLQIVGALTSAFGLFMGIISKAIAVIRIAVTVFKFFNMIMLANPIGLVITAILALIAVAVLLWKNWDVVVEKTFQFAEKLEQIFVDIMDKVLEVLSNAWEFIYDLWETALSFVMDNTSEAFEMVLFHIQMAMESVWIIIETIWTYIRETFLNALAFIKALVTGDFAVMKDLIGEQWELIKETFFIVWEQIKEIFINVLTAIGIFVIDKFISIKEFLSELWEGVKVFMGEVWDAILMIIGAVINKIKSDIELVFNAIATVISTIWNTIKAVSVAVWNGIVNTIRGIINAFKSAISGSFNAIKTVISTVWNTIKSLSSSIWNGIKSSISGVVTGISSTISRVFNGIRSAVTGVWNGIKSSTDRVWQGIVNSIKGAINGVIGAINGMLGAISSIRINTPKIPSWVPKFGGKSMSIGFPNLPRIPSLATGGVVAEPTLAMVGDAGRGNPEIVAPQKMIAHIVAQELKKVFSEFKKSYSNNNPTPYTQPQPLVLNVRLGRSEFVTFVEDITKEQERNEHKLDKYK